MTITTPITTIESRQRTRQPEKTRTGTGSTPTPRGIRALAAVSRGLFRGRTVAPVAEMQRIALHVERTSRVGRQAAA